MKFKLKKGDLVTVIAGKDKGKQGKVMTLYTERERIVVEGVARVKRHTKPSQTNPQGGILEKEGSIHISNVMLLDPKTNKGGRVKSVIKGDKKIRVFKKSGTELKA
ncbi:MAG: 50S ribosomal protein L24 [Proteobacteria bacterium]|jgi:large subunit ribosomal protein L24|nr:MAG: 50S ribosomal protein L24 [Pseudomonadota bacterium]